MGHGRHGEILTNVGVYLSGLVCNFLTSEIYGSIFTLQVDFCDDIFMHI